jgi:mono/diheme cytochrome c family protein
MIIHRVSSVLMTITLATCTAAVLAASSAQAQDAAAVYSKSCAACHGPTGKGDGPAGKFLNPKPADFAVTLKGKDDAWIAKAIKGGGAALGESPVMPPYPNLTDDQVKALVDYLKHFNS